MYLWGTLGHLIQLTTHPEWIAKIRAEVAQVAAKYAEDPTAPVHEQLRCVPLEAWETELPLMEMALKETMRLNFQTPMVRRNTTNEDILVGDEVIPGRALVVSDVKEIIHVGHHSLRLDSCSVLPQYLRSHEPRNLPRSRSLGSCSVLARAGRRQESTSCIPWMGFWKASLSRNESTSALRTSLCATMQLTLALDTVRQTGANHDIRFLYLQIRVRCFGQ